MTPSCSWDVQYFNFGQRPAFERFMLAFHSRDVFQKPFMAMSSGSLHVAEDSEEDSTPSVVVVSDLTLLSVP